MTKKTALTDYPKPSVAVDLAILTVHKGALQVLLTRRSGPQITGHDWALPGGFVHIDKTLDETVAHVLRKKTALNQAHLEQLATYGALDRDPRGRVISIAYFALVPAVSLLSAIQGQEGHLLAQIKMEDDKRAVLSSQDNDALALAFDHGEIISDVVQRLRGKLDYSAIGYALLPNKFTLHQAQEVHQAILGKTLGKPAFRRKLLDREMICPTGEFEKGAAYRPAELYQCKPVKEI